MKIQLILVFCAFCFLSACSKRGYELPQPTSLKITVIDEFGNTVPAASVYLYTSLANLSIGNNIASNKTDVYGAVVFDSLEPIQYFWFAKLGCKSNAFGLNKSATAIIKNAQSTVSTTIASTGELTFSNISSNPYKVYINSEFYRELPAGTMDRVTTRVGNYVIRVLQVSGYAITPTDKSFTGTLVCGNTLSTTFP